MKKKILALSVGRSDYDRYYPILNGLNKSRKVKLYLYLTKSHQDIKFGKTENYIDNQFRLFKKKFKKKDFKKDISLGFCDDLIFFNKIVNKIKPDFIIVLGDRYEMLIGPITALTKNIPVIHLFGGAVTEGATDELVRHAITKMSHYHLVVLKNYKKRVLQLGEENWRIKTIGLHELNFKKKIKSLTKKTLIKKYGFDFSKPYCLLTFHPITLELKILKFQLKNLLNALKSQKINVVATYPNADPKHDQIIHEFKKVFSNKKKYLLVKNLGIQSYTSVARYCDFFIGNSSSGIVESGTFAKPAINIGARQDGKFHPINVINSSYKESDIKRSIKKALNKKFLKMIKNKRNPYESKISIQKVINFIIRLKVNNKFLKKKFVNL